LTRRTGTALVKFVDADAAAPGLHCDRMSYRTAAIHWRTGWCRLHQV
jgi:hypothetical protein